MIDLIAHAPDQATAVLVNAAFSRSISQTQIRHIAPAHIEHTHCRILVIINATELDVVLIQQWRNLGPCKLILFGSLPKRLMETLGLQMAVWPDNPHDWSRSKPAPSHAYAESLGKIVYCEQASTLGSKDWHRPLERFDFTDEWNNLGYGAIRMDASPWSLSIPVASISGFDIANVVVDDQTISAYSVLKDEPTCSTLWFNRAVGPIDSFEWRLVENFLSSWRHDQLPCQPVFADIPWGCDAAVTMRLDCDEDIESARPLRRAYHQLGVPFSLAIHTSNLSNPEQHLLLQEMASAGESILSHTSTHAPNWGGSYEAALIEARESIAAIANVSGINVRYAVSPFHQSPPYALAALADAGLSGCIGGIIRNDPEFLIARGGLLANLPQGFIGHSQQHMLHGDCLLAGSDPLAISKKAFDLAYESGTLFGYLDHPFSPRYQYGWANEEERIDAHQTLIAYIRQKASQVMFLSENQAMDFLLEKSHWRIVCEQGAFHFHRPTDQELISTLTPAIEFKGQRFMATQGRMPL